MKQTHNCVCFIVLNHECSVKTAILADCDQRSLHV